MWKGNPMSVASFQCLNDIFQQMSVGHWYCWAQRFLLWPHCALQTFSHSSIWLHSRPRSEGKFMSREENKKNIYINSLMQLNFFLILWTEYMWAHNPNREQCREKVRWCKVTLCKRNKWMYTHAHTGTHACTDTKHTTYTHKRVAPSEDVFPMMMCPKFQFLLVTLGCKISLIRPQIQWLANKLANTLSAVPGQQCPQPFSLLS